MTIMTECASSVEAEYFESGFRIGQTGANPSLLEVWTHHSPATRTQGETAYYHGLLAGRQDNARQTGYEQGLGGQLCDRPATVHRRFDREFIAGWQQGADEWADREAIMREDEQQEWASEQERIYADQDADCRWHDAEIAEAGGWYRAALTRGAHG